MKKNTLLYFLLSLLFAFTLTACGNSEKDNSSLKNSSLIQFNPELVDSDNFMYVIEGETYSTQTSDYVVENKKTKVIISQIECPNKEVWSNPVTSSGVSMFDTYTAGDTPYIVTFTDTISEESKELYVVCYTREEATEKGLIQESFSFNPEFIQNDTMNVLEDTVYPTDITQYVVAEDPSSIMITSYIYPNGSNLIDNNTTNDFLSDMHKSYDINKDFPSTPYAITFTDNLTGYTKTLSVYVYPKDTEEKILFAPSVIDLATYDFECTNSELIVGTLINKEEYKELCYYLNKFFDDYNNPDVTYIRGEYIIPSGINTVTIVESSIGEDWSGTPYFFATIPGVEDSKLLIKIYYSGIVSTYPDSIFSIQVVDILTELD